MVEQIKTQPSLNEIGEHKKDFSLNDDNNLDSEHASKQREQ